MCEMYFKIFFFAHNPLNQRTWYTYFSYPNQNKVGNLEWMEKKIIGNYMNKSY